MMLSRILRWFGVLVWIVGGVVLIAWVAGRVFTDRWLWLQYCFWLPSVLALPAAGVCAGVGIGFGALSRRAARHRWVPGRREIRAAAGAGAMLALAAAYTGVVEWRLVASGPGAPARVFRVLHWNASGNIGRDWERRILDQDPDVVVINPASHQSCEGLIEKYRPYGPPIYRFGFTVFSKHRVVRTAITPLGVSLGSGLDPRMGESLVRRADPGHAMFVELETTAVLGRRLVVWCVDLPSDISLHRRVVTAEASRALAEYAGAVSVLGPDGVWSQETPAVAGFPRPDLLLGDLNTPRGSGSLELLTGGLDSVYDQAGSGAFGTWPYRWPLWHLDQMFIAPWLRGIVYVPLDLGGGTHRAQRADLAARDP